MSLLCPAYEVQNLVVMVLFFYLFHLLRIIMCEHLRKLIVMEYKYVYLVSQGGHSRHQQTISTRVFRPVTLLNTSQCGNFDISKNPQAFLQALGHFHFSVTPHIVRLSMFSAHLLHPIPLSLFLLLLVSSRMVSLPTVQNNL